METPPSSQSHGQVSTHNQWGRHPNDATVIPKGMSLLVGISLSLWLIPSMLIQDI